MSTTAIRFIEGVRPLVSDVDQPYRWSDQQIIFKVDEATQVIFSMRPDAFDTLGFEAPDEVDSKFTEVPILRKYKQAMMYYIASSLLAERSSDKSLRTQGADFQKLFERQMKV